MRVAGEILDGAIHVVDNSTRVQGGHVQNVGFLAAFSRVAVQGDVLDADQGVAVGLWSLVLVTGDLTYDGGEDEYARLLAAEG